MGQNRDILMMGTVLRGSDEWGITLKVIHGQGRGHIATTAFTFPGR